ncbi:hypothetical protein E8E14_005923 [Neopestalotiopsis sp. 37M]|nr:hypothetical protein E8E14_005923 [Neopestalotiopsis sp. 37M]
MTASQETDTYLSFDDKTHAWIQQLHEAWSSDAPISTFATIRDALLERREHLDTYVSTLGAVVKIACPRDVENNDDGRWNHFFNLGALTKARGKENDRKRKRTYNEANRLRNLALIAALWSPAIVFHYGWNTASQIQMNMLRVCATRYPRFVQDFRPRLNQVLFNRHCEGIKNGRTKSLTEARLQPHRDFDINTLASVVPDESISICWVNSRDGNVPIDGDGTLLRVVRPQHFHQYLLRRDRYGILDARQEDCRPCSPPASGLDLVVENSTQVDAQSTMEYQDPNVLHIFGSNKHTSSLSGPSSRNTPQPSSPASSSVLSEDILFSNASTTESTEGTAPTSVTPLSAPHLRTFPSTYYGMTAGLQITTLTYR